MRTFAKLVTVLLLLVGGGALADNPSAATPPPAATTPTTGVSGGVSVSVQVQAAAKLSVGEMTAQTAKLTGQISADSRHITFLKEQAKKAKDVIKLTCVNDKIVQLKAQQNIADATNDQLQAALLKSSDDRVNLFIQYSSTAEAIRRLREEAGACIGEPELYKQESGGPTSEHPEIPDDPEHDKDLHGGGDLEPPGYASPFS